MKSNLSDYRVNCVFVHKWLTMGTFHCILFFIAVITLPKACVAMKTMDDDVYQQLLRRVENLEKRDQQQQAEIDTLRGELNTEKQRNVVLEERLSRLVKTLDLQREDDGAKPKFDETKTPGDGNAWNIQSSGEPTSSRNILTSKQSGNQASRIRRHIDMPVIAFHATLNTIAKHIGLHQSIAFDRVVTNMGTAYNTHNGSFVAPITGIYVFHTTLQSLGRQMMHASIVKNNRTSVANLFSRGVDSPFSSHSAMGIVHLDSGDEVVVLSNDADLGMDGDNYSMFSGFLLYQDHAFETIIG